MTTDAQKIAAFNALSGHALEQSLEKCCGAKRWVQAMVARAPFSTIDALHKAADEAGAQLSESDWLEAFSHHPRIGGEIETLRKKFASTAGWAQNEQASVQSASENVLQALARGNTQYEKNFGYIFIVCATGKSADEMLALLEKRLHNAKSDEIKIAAAEQMKITHIRLDKALNS